MDFVYMQSRYIQLKLTAQHTMHKMANCTRYGSSTRNCSTQSGGRSGRTDQYPSGKSQGSSSRNDYQNSGASSRGTHSNQIDQQCHQSGGDNGDNESCNSLQMSDCDDNDDEPQSPCGRTRPFNKCSYSCSLNNQGGVMTHPTRDLCLSDNF